MLHTSLTSGHPRALTELNKNNIIHFPPRCLQKRIIWIILQILKYNTCAHSGSTCHCLFALGGEIDGRQRWGHSLRTTYASVLFPSLYSVCIYATHLRLKYAQDYILYHHEMNMGILHTSKSSLVITFYV